MTPEPWWGVLIGMAIAIVIKTYLDNRKSPKVAASGLCPKCKSTLVDKEFPTVTLRVCPEKHGYLAGDDSWVEASYVKHVTKKYRDLPLEEVPREHVLFWTMYRELFE